MAKYYVVVYQKDENGKLRQKWISTGIPVQGRNQTKADAALHRILTELEAQNAKSTSFLVTKLKFVEALLAWVEYKKYEIRTNTYELYTLNLNKHIIPFFEKKNKLVTKITIDDIEDYYKAKLKEGLSIETIKKHNIIIRGTLERLTIRSQPQMCGKLKIMQTIQKGYNKADVHWTPN